METFRRRVRAPTPDEHDWVSPDRTLLGHRGARSRVRIHRFVGRCPLVALSPAQCLTRTSASALRPSVVDPDRRYASDLFTPASRTEGTLINRGGNDGLVRSAAGRPTSKLAIVIFH